MSNNSDRYSIKNGDFDIELAFASEVLKIPSLHYGYWLNNQALSLANLPKAQTQYTKFVCDQIPKRIKTILDVGAGLGDVSELLINKGYIVTAISPNPTHQKRFIQLTKKKKNFNYIFTKFEDFKASEKFDLLMFNESSSYIEPNKLFEKANELVENNGYIQICDIFSKRNPAPIGKNSTIENFKSIGERNGFKEMNRIDITLKTIPSLQIGKDLYVEYVSPSMTIAKQYYEQEHRLKAFLLKTLLNFFLKNELKSFNDYFEKVFDPKEFKKHFTYQLVLFKKI